MTRFLIILILVLSMLDSPVIAETECFGEYPYRVCTSTTTSPSGDIQVESWDTSGNRYSISTESQRLPGGGHEITSQDSIGNSYKIRSWCDNQGCHTVDSQGNDCTITPSGRMIGCGQ